MKRFGVFIIILFLTSPLLVKLFNLASIKVEELRYGPDIKQIETNYSELCKSITGNEYSTAYNLMVPEFRQKYTLNTFKASSGHMATNSENLLSFYNCEVADSRRFVFEDRHQKVTFFPHQQGFFSNHLVGLGIEMEKQRDNWYFTGNADHYVD